VSRSGGFALLCNAHGNITKVLSDSLGLETIIQPGVPFARLAVRGGLAKALSFVTEINAQGAAYDWEINIAVGEQIKTLHFTGSKVNEDMLIVGAENGKFALKLYDEMMQMSNEQTNALRSALKDQSRIEKDDSQYDEISRLNNELVSMQRELAKKNAELEHLNKEKNRFLGMAAHDLRNPLQSILIHSSFLLEEDPAALGADYRKFMEIIHTSSEFMARLVDDLLDVAKIESGQLHLDYSQVDLGALVSNNVALNRVLGAKKQIDIQLFSEKLPPVVVDSAKIEQVLNNLIGNALKFSVPGSKIEVRLRSEGESFRLSIKDEGPGMSEEEMSKLFKPFQRGQAKGTAGEESTGLGLMIVKRIVEGHGGKLWLESRLGAGTTFFVSIPFQPLE
jgi:two-component system, OmpR family, sensor kinase